MEDGFAGSCPVDVWDGASFFSCRGREKEREGEIDREEENGNSSDPNNQLLTSHLPAFRTLMTIKIIW